MAVRQMQHAWGGAARFGALIVLALIGASAVDAFVYNFPYDFGPNPGLVFREGPMYASGKGPFGETAPSSITARIVAASGPVRATKSMRINFAQYDRTTWQQLAFPVGDPQSPPADITNAVEWLECCTMNLYKSGDCGDKVGIGELRRYSALPASAQPAASSPPPRAPSVVSYLVSGDFPQPLDNTTEFPIVTEGSQYLAIMACDATSYASSASLPAYPATLTLTFVNPYGYLPGQVFGLFPFYGALFVAYVVSALAFLALMLRFRQYLLHLQLGTLLLLVLGTVETAAWFFMLNSKNKSGVPTPCDVCGPATTDYVVASVLTVFKRALSRALLLAVALGYGVVKPQLDRATVTRIVALALAYSVFGVLDEVEKAETYAARESAWVLGLLVVDMVCFVWTYTSLRRIELDLKVAQQLEKLKMYMQLEYVITGCAVVYCSVAVAIILIRTGTMPLDWKGIFFLLQFWDLLYLAVLLAVAWIWAPGESSFRYVSYSQPPAAGGATSLGGGPDGPDGPDAIDEALEDEDNSALSSAPVRPQSVGIEMSAVEKGGAAQPAQASAPAAAAAAKKGGAAPGAQRKGFAVVEEEDDEDDGDIGVAPSRASAAASSAAAGTAPLGAKAASSARAIDSRPLAPPGPGGPRMPKPAGKE